MIYVFWTCRDKEEAQRVVHALLEQHLIACASLLPEVQSIYRWEGKIEEGREVKVILKTQGKHYSAVQDSILAHCSYTVPEICRVDVAQVNPAYLAWLTQETSNLRSST